MLTQKYYNNILRKDLILKVIPEQKKKIPEIEKLELRIIFPKIIDDYSQILNGITYLEELTGQIPIYNILSTKRIGAQEYEKTVLIKVTLRKKKIYHFLLYLSIALLFYWEDSKNVLIVKATSDEKNKIVQLSNKEFFYLFNMPIEYDDRQFEWNFQVLFYFKNSIQNVNKELLNYFLSHYIPYTIFDLKKKKEKK